MDFETTTFAWILTAVVAAFFALFSALFWVWGGILYYAVLMASNGQKPPDWMWGFITIPATTQLSRFSVQNQRKAFRIAQVVSVALLTGCIVLGIIGVRADFRNGWDRGVEVSVNYFLPLVAVWLGVVLGFECYVKNVMERTPKR